MTGSPPFREGLASPASHGPGLPGPAGPLEDVLARWALGSVPAGAPGRALVSEVAAAGGDAVDGILFFGSQLVRTSPDAHSAYDFVVVARQYEALYRNLHTAGALTGSSARAARLNRWLPPNMLAFRGTVGAAGPAGASGPLAKLAVTDAADFERALGEDARDHFFLGRLAQRVAIVHARDVPTSKRLLALLAQVVRQTVRWAAPSLPETFGPEEYCRRMLQVSYFAEIRPESGTRVAEVVRQQEAFFREVYGALFEEEAVAGTLVRTGPGAYRLALPPGAGERVRVSLYFRVSKVRATLRWAKYVLTFEGWLDYIARKIERRTGMTLTLTTAERRWPFLFLWPRAVRVLWTLWRGRRHARETA